VVKARTRTVTWPGSVTDSVTRTLQAYAGIQKSQEAFLGGHEVGAGDVRGLRIKRQSTAQAIGEALREEITHGRLSPRERLIESDLAKRLAVSRTPLREALRQLEAEGFAERLPSGGLVVIGTDSVDLRDIVWLRGVLEAHVAEEVAIKATPGQVDQLERILDRMDLLMDHHDHFLALGRDFHDELAALFGNQRCRAILRQLRRHLDRYWEANTDRRRERPRHASREHRKILAAIRLRDGVGAAAAMRAHVMAEAEIAMETVQIAQQSAAAADTQAELGRAVEG
jgi:DNA-binding GntR family transcriptional regulator